MSRLRNERGWALVTGMMVISVMMVIGLASLAFVDGQSSASGKERVHESAFNAAEAVLNTGAFTLARTWPGNVESAIPACTSANGALTVTPATGNAALCPDAATLAQTLNGADYASGVTWSTEVRDNGGTSRCNGLATTNCSYFYDDVATRAQPSWDANGDNELWLRAQALVGNQHRTVVSRVKATRTSIVFPRSALTAGKFKVTTGGPKPFLTLNGSTLGLRCAPLTDQSCLGTTRPNGQIVYPGEVISLPSDPAHVLTASQRDQLRQTAQARGTYYGPGRCPSGAAGYSGLVVFVESANCQLSGSGTVNSPGAPGIVFFNSGTLRFTGSLTFYGTVYMYNEQGSTASDIFDAGGASRIYGSVFVDGQGGMSIGGNSRVIFDANAQANVSTYSGTALVRSSFREIDG